MSDKENILREDKKSHPKCEYSTQKRKTCNIIDGKEKCEIIEKIYRLCSGKRDVLIYENTETIEKKMCDNDKNSSNNRNLSFSVEIPDVSDMLNQFQEFANEFVIPGINEFNNKYKSCSEDHDEYIPKNNFSSHSDGSVDL